jgi:hypothetical protein
MKKKTLSSILLEFGEVCMKWSEKVDEDIVLLKMMIVFKAL